MKCLTDATVTFIKMFKQCMAMRWMSVKMIHKTVHFQILSQIDIYIDNYIVRLTARLSGYYIFRFS